MKEKLLVIWILAVVAFGFLCYHVLNGTVFALQKAVAFSFLPVLGLVKFAAGVWCMNLLP